MNRPDICLYPGHCADGFAAAWAIWKRWGRWGDDVTFQAVRYGEAPPDVTGKHVLIVDFSYKAPVLRQMAKTAASITVLDHHKSALEDLREFVGEVIGGGQNVEVVFDMAKSGAMLAWEYAHPDTSPPALVLHVQDRDLWTFELEGTREIHAALMSHPYHFETWDGLADMIEPGSEMRNRIIVSGQAILRAQAQAVAEAIALTRRTITIGGHTVPVANIPKSMASDAANIMAEGHPFAACYFDTAAGKREFSLRSRPDGADVAKIAEAFGGGGHARAAGFTVGGGWEGEPL
jgi:oligoribonuclease NrnB/cAMP/cGMP phosphodiesterase (DHH superfamily)